ncbi:MAG TPA: hypothetical protein VI432_00495 [Candidatus Paceibacterota bacterium]
MVYFDPKDIEEMTLTRIANALPAIIAKHLSAGRNRSDLKPSDIEVICNHFKPPDMYSYDLAIVIWANDFPERKHNLEDRKNGIVADVRSLMPSGTRGFVWILLAPASFGEFDA